jgi:hypothetical protein
MGVASAAKVATPLDRGPIYAALRADVSDGAVLELPAAIGRNGEVTLNVQEFMLHQPLHEKPLVVGRPPRHRRASVAFCEETDVVYELTHPWTLGPLAADPTLKARRRWLVAQGRSILTSHRIRYIVFHANDDFFPLSERQAYARFLNDALGRPAIVQPNGTVLFRIF